MDLLKTNQDNKVNAIEGKISNITSVATTAALSAVKNVIANVIKLVKNRLWCKHMWHWL